MNACALAGPGSLFEVGWPLHTGCGLAAPSFLLTGRGSAGSPPFFLSPMEVGVL
jgi:hypothetical protein